MERTVVAAHGNHCSIIMNLEGLSAQELLEVPLIGLYIETRT